MEKFNVSTSQRIDMVDITDQVQQIIHSNGLKDGTVTLFVPHTTCGITINENTDPDVVRDIKYQMEKLVPYEEGYRHYEKNSDSHIKTAITGSSETVIIQNGALALGTWQGIFLCDFDGPRMRSVWVKLMAG